MSYFSNALQVVLERRRISQAQLSRDSGMGKSLLNGYINGDYRPAQDWLEKICAALEPADAVEVAIAHLCDEMPVDIRQHIRIINLLQQLQSADHDASVRLRESAPDVPTGLPKKVRESFEFLHSIATEKDVQDWIVQTVALLKD